MNRETVLLLNFCCLRYYKLTGMAEKVTESVTITSQLLEIIIVDNVLKGIVPKPVSNVL